MDQNIYELIKKKLDKTITVEETFKLLSYFAKIFSESNTANEENEIEKIINAFKTIGFYENKEFFFEFKTHLLISQLMKTLEDLSGGQPYFNLNESYADTFRLIYNNIAILNIFKEKEITYTICKEAPFANLDLSQCDDPKYVCQNHEIISQFIDKVLSESIDIKKESQDDSHQEETTRKRLEFKGTNLDDNYVYSTSKLFNSATGIYNVNTSAHKILAEEHEVNISTANRDTEDTESKNEISTYISQEVTKATPEIEDENINKFLSSNVEDTNLDKRLEVVWNNFLQKGYRKVSFNTFANEFYQTSNVKTERKDKLYALILKGFSTITTIHNQGELAHKYNVRGFSYQGVRLRGSISGLRIIEKNGKQAKDYSNTIIIFEDTPIIDENNNIVYYSATPILLEGYFRNQITTVKKAVDNYPLSKTDRNDNLHHYLYERTHLKTFTGNKATVSIKLETILEKIGVLKDKYKNEKIYKKEVHRVMEDIEILFKHYKSYNEIISFRTNKRGTDIINTTYIVKIREETEEEKKKRTKKVDKDTL